ncbi:MarR family winged helix-turn-helix transcriptional regulator [Patulibacter minatonensis]|uniref:MarR family winged helix-turn-helix transcriptional regulator n=1 Tax=Patulibacter minatonensis TaxID=298163 RepID=UPI0004AD8F22|nr:MarR family winged helix-turn-helix transcriptional regulator [Patulibacter minatonensis]
MSSSLGPEELARWEAWKRSSDAVIERVRREVRTATGLSNADFGVLKIVAAAGGTVRQQALCDGLEWTQSRTSNHLSRMERRGLVVRETLEGGGVEITATARGAELIGRAVPVHAAAVREHLLERLDDTAHGAIAELAADLTTSPG